MNKVISLLIVVLLNISIVSAKRVVSLAPFITHAIYELNQQHQLVGCTQFCLIDKKDSIVIVADALNANVERIVALKPDLVIAGELTHPNIVKAIEMMGITCEHWRQPGDFEGMCRQLQQLSESLGCRSRADSIIEQCSRRLSVINNRVFSDLVPKIFIQVGANPLYTIMEDTFMADFIRKLHGTNISASLKSGQISSEFVLKSNPDVILITTMGGIGNQEQQRWMDYSTLKASRNRKIFLIDEYDLCSPTPITFINTLEKLYKLIYE